MTYSRQLLKDLRHVADRRQRNVEFHYYVLFADKLGYERATLHSDFSVVSAVHLLDESHRAFSPASRIYQRPRLGISADIAEGMSLQYGLNLVPESPLGFGNLQLLLAFHHNIPDNSLPILWYDQRNVAWEPIFPRYNKVY